MIISIKKVSMETKELKNGLSIIELEERHEMAVAPASGSSHDSLLWKKCDNRCQYNNYDIWKKLH